MKLETKFDIGQDVWYLKAGFFIPKNGEVIEIKYNGRGIIYEIEFLGNIQEEQYVFATREEAEAKLKEME